MKPSYSSICNAFFAILDRHVLNPRALAVRSKELPDVQINVARRQVNRVNAGAALLACGPIFALCLFRGW